MPSAKFSPPVCIFCGTGPTTEEDIIPRWIARHLGGNPRTRRHTVDTKAGTHSVFKAYSLTATARITCQKCNNNFVSRFDSKASGLLKQMLTGKAALSLSPDSILALARWAMKQALLIPYAIAGVGPKAIPAEAYAEFRQSGMPPGNRAKLYVAQYRVGRFSTTADVHWFRLTTPPGTTVPAGLNLNAYGFTFCIQNLVFHGAGIVEPGYAVAAFPHRFTRFLLPLWPVGGRQLVWPPTRTLDDAGLVELGQLFRTPPSGFFRPAGH